MERDVRNKERKLLLPPVACNVCDVSSLVGRWGRDGEGAEVGG